MLATRWVYRALYPRREFNEGHDDPDASATMKAVYAALAALAREAAALCEPGARAIAMRFSPHLRLWLYGQLVADRTGRLAQLSAVCPGALTFAFALEKAAAGWARSAADAGPRLLGDVVAGRRLARVVAGAVEKWASEMERRDTGERVDPVWERLRWTSTPERDQLIARQSLLVRRAGPMVPTTILFLPPPIAFAPEDIPSKVRNNARWFAMVKCSRMLIGRPVPADRERLQSFSAFVSRNAPALLCYGSTKRARMLVEYMRDYAIATNHWPVRATSARYLCQALQWHERMANLAGGGPREPPIGVQRTVSTPPPGEWRDHAGSVMIPLTSADHLVAEGARMGHCVASRCKSVARGWSAVYRATIDGESLTVEIAPGPAGRWRICEAKGLANREPTALEWSVLRRWEAGLS